MGKAILSLKIQIVYATLIKYREVHKMKKYFELLIRELVVIVICAIIGVAALAMTYFIPQNSMRDNVIESAIILHDEGLGKCLWEGINETKLDGFTDGLLINVSYTETKDGIRDILLGTYVEVDERNPMDSLYEMIALSNDDYVVDTYGRYWHGYQIILRPLLCFFTYSDIRQINMILQLALVFWFVCMLAGSADRELIIPFLGMYIFLSPISLFSSLQYSSCFYVMMFSLIMLLMFRKRMNNIVFNYLLLLAGIAIAYFDLLTYPLITLGAPLILYLDLESTGLKDVKTFLKKCVNIGCYTASWCIGYVGMWASKWFIASVLTDENIVYNALQQIKYRSGYDTQQYKYFDTIKLNLRVCNIKVLLLATVCLLVCLFVYRMKNHTKFEKGRFPYTGILFWEYQHILSFGIFLLKIIPVAIPILHGENWRSACLPFL